MSDFPAYITPATLIAARDLINRDRELERSGAPGHAMLLRRPSYVKALNNAEDLLAEGARRGARDENGFFY